jgi:hypothetical protein
MGANEVVVVGFEVEVEVSGGSSGGEYGGDGGSLVIELFECLSGS